MMKWKFKFTLAALVAASTAGCAVGPNYSPPVLPVPQAWIAPAEFTTAHDGDTAKLKDWWASWGDAVLVELIDNAQKENATVLVATARIDAARATVTSVGSSFWPGLDAKASDNRSRSNQGSFSSTDGNSSGVGATTSRNRNASIDALWELDLFGSVRRSKEAASARAEARNIDWHDARVSVAAEVATSYVNLRACEILLVGYERDAKSRAETARLTDLKAKAGFTAPAEAALSNASASEAAARLTQQRADCDIEVKALSLITVTPEPQLRAKLAAKSAVFPIPAGWPLERVPAVAIAQRPDVAVAERELAAASAEIGVAEADRYPRITLVGSIGYGISNFGGTEDRGRTWSYGPAISVPIFDAGRRAANVDAARARYAEALATYKGRVALAIREVEQSLVRIASATNRDGDSKAALKGYEVFLIAADARVRVGAANQVELEEARRAVVAAQGAVVNVERERLTSWITLYKSVGGAWKDVASGKSEILTKASQ